MPQLTLDLALPTPSYPAMVDMSDQAVAYAVWLAWRAGAARLVVDIPLREGLL